MSPRIVIIKGLSFGTALIHFTQRIEKLLFVPFEVSFVRCNFRLDSFLPCVGGWLFGVRS